MFRAAAADDVENAVLDAARTTLNSSLIADFNALQRSDDKYQVNPKSSLKEFDALLLSTENEFDSIKESDTNSFDKLKKLALKRELLKEIITGFVETNTVDVRSLYQENECVERPNSENESAISDRLKRGELTPFEAICSKRDLGPKKSREILDTNKTYAEDYKDRKDRQFESTRLSKRMKVNYVPLNSEATFNSHKSSDFIENVDEESSPCTSSDSTLEKWACPMCTFLNEISFRRCSVCNCHRPPKPIQRYSSPTNLQSSDSDINNATLKRLKPKGKRKLKLLEDNSPKMQDSHTIDINKNSDDELKSSSDEADAPESHEKKKKSKAYGDLIDDFRDSNYKKRLSRMSKVEIQNDKVAEKRDVVLEGGLKIDGKIAKDLFQYQLTGIRWMWQLHEQGAGGIVGDEMGLGKTVQVAAYLGALYGVGRLNSCLILAPATVLAHWTRELHRWAPNLRVILLHRSGNSFNEAWHLPGGVHSFVKRSLAMLPAVVMLTSYEGLRRLQGRLLSQKWDVVVLDEAQRIRNPDAEITLLCKQLRTSARLALTGTPIQNSLLELWSLFDFVFPGRLGTLPAFDEEFATPIRVGGYANAPQAQAQIAFQSSIVLREIIDPYLLRRQKKDVRDSIRLPKKTEQVLFCRLSQQQRSLYMDVISSPQIQSLLRGDGSKGHRLQAISILRKLCNHADLTCPPNSSIQFAFDHMTKGSHSSDSEFETQHPSEFGDPNRSGKLMVLQQLLPIWKKERHRVLVFTQTRKMLSILENWVNKQGWKYERMDGCTPIGTRQGLIDRFNSNDSIFLMLLTTRTGGVGTNLTGADRVVLFDPDWNPSTDIQARERAWRVGQSKPVTVYRLITAGTIEEKIYHRQIFKTALTNRVLKDPKQQRLFNRTDLHDLFMLGDDGSIDGITETSDAFNGAGIVKVNKIDRSKKSHDVEGLVAEVEVSIGNGEKKNEHEDKNYSADSKDTNVLRALFDGAPLSSVFMHDLAEGGSYLRQQRRARLEKQAEIAAQAAMERLRESRRAVHADLNSSAGSEGQFLPTWTGRNGFGGRRFGSNCSAEIAPQSSLSLLNHIQNCNAQEEDSNSTLTLAMTPKQEEKLLCRLQNFLKHGSKKKIKTADLLREFRDVPDNHAAMFKQLLKSVADCKRGVWTWKDHVDL